MKCDEIGRWRCEWYDLKEMWSVMLSGKSRPVEAIYAGQDGGESGGDADGDVGFWICRG